MAKLEKIFHDISFRRLNDIIKDGILSGSSTAELEDWSNFESDGAKCSVMVFERFSYTGGNRVSLSITLFQNGDGPTMLSAITSGGSQAIFFKMNTLGEEAFLKKVGDLLEEIRDEDE